MKNYTARSKKEAHNFSAKDAEDARHWVFNHLDCSQEWNVEEQVDGHPELGGNAKPNYLSPGDLAMNAAKDARIEKLNLVLDVLRKYATPPAIDRIGIMAVVQAEATIESEIRILQDSKFITLGELAEQGRIPG